MIQTIDGSFLSSDDIHDMLNKLKQQGIEDVSSDIFGNQVVLRFNDLATQSQAFSDLKTNILSAENAGKFKNVIANIKAYTCIFSVV